MPIKFSPYFSKSPAVKGERVRQHGSLRPLGLVLVSALSLATGLAQAAPVPTNHVYISYHGRPSYSVTVSFLDSSNKLLYQKKDRVTAKKLRYPYNFPVAKVWVSLGINFWLMPNRYAFDTSATTYDHCILVGPGSTPKYTGDNTTGCNGK